MPGQTNIRAQVLLRSNSAVTCSLVKTKWSVVMHFVLVDSVLGYRLARCEVRRVLESKYVLIPRYELLDISSDWFKLVYSGLKREANTSKYVQGLLCFLKAFGGCYLLSNITISTI